MPQKKKIMRDKRDALEILREAFDPRYTGQNASARVAEIDLPQKRRVKTAAARTESGNGYREPIEEQEKGLSLAESKNVEKERRRQKRETGGDTYREPIDPEDLAGPKGAEKKPRQKGNPLRTKEEDPVDTIGAEQPEKPPKEELDEAQKAVLQELNTEAGPFNQLDVSKIKKQTEHAPSETEPEKPKAAGVIKSLRERMDVMEASRTKLSPEERQKLDDLNARVTKEIEGVTPSPPAQNEVEQKQTERQEPPPKTTKPDTKEPSDLDIGGIEQELKKNLETPTTEKSEKPDTAEEKKAQEEKDNTAKARMEEASRKQPHTVQSLERKLPEAKPETKSQERVQPESREERSKKHDARLAELEAKKIAGTGTAEEHRKYGGLKTAHDNNYDGAAIDKKIKEYEQQKNLVGIDALTLDLLRRARAIMEGGKEAAAKPEETKLVKPKEKTSLEPRSATLSGEEAQPEKNQEPKKEAPVEEKKPPAVEKNTERYQDPEKAFEEFGISAENLRALDTASYDKLSNGQKRLLFHNFNQIVSARIQTEAAVAYRNARKEDATHGNMIMRWFNAVSAAATKGTESMRRAAAMHKTAMELREGGIAEYGPILTHMMKGLAEHGPGVTEHPDGSLDIRYIQTHELAPTIGRIKGSYGSHEKALKQLDAYNAAAHTVEEIPHQWSLREASVLEKRKYRKAHEAFEKAERAVIRLVAHTGTPEEIAHHMQRLSEVKAQVRVNQLLHSHPDAERFIQNAIAAGKNASVKRWLSFSMRKPSAERTAAFAAGFITRSLTLNPLFWAAAPMSAAAAGALRERARLRETYEEELALTRAGEHSAKTKNHRPTEHFSKRLDTLLDKLHSFETPGTLPQKEAKARDTILRHIDQLVTLTDKRIDQGLVIYGKGAAGAVHAYEISTKLADAKAELARAGYDRTEQAANWKKRLETMGLVEKRGKDVTQGWKTKQAAASTAWAAAMAATYALAGMKARSVWAAPVEDVDTTAATPLKTPPENLPIAPTNGGKESGILAGADLKTEIESAGVPTAETPLNNEQIKTALEQWRSGGKSPLTDEQVEEALKQYYDLHPKPEEYPKRGLESAGVPTAETPLNNEQIKTALEQWRSGGKSPLTDEQVEEALKQYYDLHPKPEEYPKRGLESAGVPHDETASMPEKLSLNVKSRGPEGAIIDEFRKNPELAKEFGWNGADDIDAWAGKEAHQIWLQNAKEAIKKPELVEHMKKLGYLKGLSKNELNDETILLGRYSEMMHRIQKGSSFRIDPAQKLIDLSTLKFLKARA